MTEDTSAYWRKLLAVDAPADPKAIEKCRSWQRNLRPLFFSLYGIVSRMFFPISVVGLDNIPKPPYIIAPNHQSFLDFPSLAQAMGKEGRNLCALSNKIYYDNPVSRFFMFSAADVIRIDTEKDFFPALKIAASILKAGKPVVIFPEGTRSRDGNLLPFKVGVGTLAVEANVPLLPVYIKGTYDIMPRGSILPRTGKITVAFGKPVYPKEYIEMKKNTPAYDVYNKITEELRNRVLELKDLLENPAKL